MRIVGNVKNGDFYDCMAKYDQEREPLFVRNKGEPVIINDVFGMPKGQNHGLMIIGFAGKFYPLMRYARRIDNYAGSPLKWYYIYDLDTIEANLAVYYKENIMNSLLAFANPNSKYLTLFDTYGPIFGIYWHWHTNYYEYNEIPYDRTAIIRNINLKQYLFHKIIPPHEAWNLLRNFLCNVARPAMPIPEMDNATKIVLAGFDPKTSFRKAKKQ